MHRWLSTLTVVLVTWGLVAAPARASDIEEIADLADRMGIPGLAIRVDGPAGVENGYHRGVDGTGRRVDGVTPFVWGSVSKSIGARVAVDLADGGELDLDHAVTAIIPAAESWVGGDVTVRDLIRHTSGLVHDVALTDVTRPGPARTAVAQMPKPERGSRGAFAYSSLNYILLQAVVESVTGASYTDIVERRIGAPSGARVISDAATFAASVPAGHVPFFTRARAVRPAFDGAGLGYGYLAGSVDALAAYARWLARDPRWSVFPTVPTGHGADYGPGLYRETIGGQELWWHSGAVPGYFTHMAVIPGSGRSFVMVVNRYGELESQRYADLARYLMLRFAGETPSLPSAGTIWSIPVAGSLVVGLGGLAVAWAAIQLVRRRGSVSRRWGRSRAAGAVVGCGIVAAAAWFGPAATGFPREVLDRWAPDVAILLTVLAVESVALGVLVLLGTATGRRSKAVLGG